MKPLLTPFAFLASSLTLHAEDIYSYADHAKPIFANACNNCHNPDKKKGGLDLSTYAGVMAGGSGGDVVSPGDPDSSKLLRCVMKKEEPFMPPKGESLTDSQIDTLRRWIAGGLRETKSGSARAAAPKKKASEFAVGSVGKPEKLPTLFPHLPLAPAKVTHRPAPVLALASNPWSPLLAVGAPGQVLFYDANTLAPLGVLPFPGVPRTLSFSSSGAVLFAAGGEAGKQGRVAAWSIATAQPLLGFEAESDEILAADLRPDLDEIALGGSARKVRFVNSLGEKQEENKKHTEWITASAYSPDGVLLATADRNGGLRVWEAATRNELHELRGHDRFVTGLSWRPDSNVLATVSEDGTARLWEMAGGTSTKKWDAHAGGVTDVAFAPDGSLATVGRNSSLKIWDGEGKLRREYKNLPALPLRTRFSSDSKHVVVGDLEGRLTLFEADGKAEKHTVQTGTNLPPLEDRIVAAGKRVAELRTAAAGGESETRRQANQALEDGKTAASLAERKLAEAKESLPAQEKRLQEAKTALASLEENIRGLAASLAKAEQDKAAWGKEAENSLTSREKLKESARQASLRLSRADSDLSQAASGDRARLAEAQAAANREAREADTRLAAAVTAATETQEKLAQAHRQVETLVKEKAEKERQAAAGRTARDEAERSLARAKAALEESEQSLAGAQKKLAGLQTAAKAAAEAAEQLPAAEAELARWQAEKLKALWWSEFVKLQELIAGHSGEGAAPADSPEVAAQKARVAEAEKAWKSSSPQG